MILSPLHRSSMLLAAAIGLTFIGVQAYWEHGLYNREIEDARVQALNLAKSLTQHAEDSFDLVDGVLLGLTERVETDGIGKEAVARLERFIGLKIREQPRIRGIFVYDGQGDWVASSARLGAGANNSDRAYFQHHATNPDKGTFLGDPVRSRSGGQWIITLSRRFEKSDGSFGGVVLASIDVAYFVEYYKRFNIGQDGLIGLVRTDGQFLARLPFSDDLPSLKLTQSGVSRSGLFRDVARSASGNREYTSPIDGRPRIGGYQVASRYPIVLQVALGRSEVLAAWRKDVVTRAAI